MPAYYVIKATKADSFGGAVRSVSGMTTTTDLNRLLWEERAAGDTSRAWESLTAEPVGLREEAGDDGLWLRPPWAGDDRVVLAIHGGGFVSGSIATHRRMFGHLALASGLTTLVVDYGLVPDHVYPAQIEQVGAIYRRPAGRRVALAGDSCRWGWPCSTAGSMASPPSQCSSTRGSWRGFSHRRNTMRRCQGYECARLPSPSPRGSGPH
ncbi:alpha/beta hydrolase [Paractinoplanes hotanensis]|uniref:Alpha/beta hydrolase n=1 Tax=Paractinoplanes hotanensis TaxID=2906497 RepID=A0ABT0XXS6_9ACTN|nr:alpha/beta hydrolase [Actinoplanes hotanensis]MCM4078583.1 alpha/beta hydrolase [Actinoplanes hotanensis]